MSKLKNKYTYLTQKVCNILRAAALIRPNVNYCQGMNYMAAFLLELTANEEEAFFMLIGLLTNTEYGTLFTDNLFKLKQFFYVIDRLIQLYMPELHVYFKNNSIMVSFFSSAWFITIFSSCYQNIPEVNNPKVLLRIWDDFIIVNGFNIEWLEGYY